VSSWMLLVELFNGIWWEGGRERVWCSFRVEILGLGQGKGRAAAWSDIDKFP
jgi:hypothetical protein